VADYGQLDKNISIFNDRFISLIKLIADYTQVGIHPSYQSNHNLKKLEEEINRLRSVIHKDITKSRQHFLSFTLPDTFRRLMDYDITDDYTMGYASQAGFRASICSPYNFYDLDLELETNLKIHPFAFMDTVLIDYLHLKPSEIVGYINPLINEVKAVNGELYAIWHNFAMSEINQWKGYKDKFEEVIKLAI